MSALDIGLYNGFIKGKYVPSEVKQEHRFKKMTARMRKPKTTCISINQDKEGHITSAIKAPRLLAFLPETELVRMTDMMASLPMSNPSLYKMIKNGSFPACFKVEGRSKYWKTQEVQRWIDQQDNLNIEKY